jgi:hypothetical protein
MSTSSSTLSTSTCPCRDWPSTSHCASSGEKPNRRIRTYVDSDNPDPDVRSRSKARFRNAETSARDDPASSEEPFACARTAAQSVKVVRRVAAGSVERASS